MEIGVYQWLFNVLNVVLGQITSLLSNMMRKGNIGLLNDAPDVNTPDGQITQSSIQTTSITLVKISRKNQIQNGIFGELSVNGESLGVTVENLERAIPEGMYEASLDLSPRLAYLCPHLKVPDRDLQAGGDAGIRIHKANYPNQLEGCIAVGTIVDGDAVDDSTEVFDNMMALLPKDQPFKVLVYALH